MKRELQTLIQEANGTLPNLPRLDEHLKKVSEELSKAAAALVDVRSRIETEIREHLNKAQLLIKREPNQINTLEEAKAYADECTRCVEVGWEKWTPKSE